MAFTPVIPVVAPEPRGTRYGLFAAAIGPLDLPEHATGGGVTWTPATCGTADAWPTLCHGDIRYAKIFDEEDESDRTAATFVAYGGTQCGSVGSTAASVSARAELRLLSGEQSVAEAALWTALAADAGLVAVVPADPTSLVAVIAELEQWLYGVAGANYGHAGYLHAPPRFAAWAAEEGLMVRDGQLWRTPYGTTWIFGGGYSDTVPDAGTIFISGQVSVWRSGVSAPPPQLDREDNQWLAIAEREYAVGWDCHVASTIFDWIPAT